MVNERIFIADFETSYINKEQLTLEQKKRERYADSIYIREVTKENGILFNNGKENFSCLKVIQTARNDNFDWSVAEFRLLVPDVLPDSFTEVHGHPFEFDDGKSDSVHIQDDIRAFCVSPVNGDLFSQSEVVLLRVVPVDEVDGV